MLGFKNIDRGRKLYCLARASEADTILGGAAICFEGFLTCFLKVPLACLGSMVAAVQLNSLGTLGKHFTKPSEQVAAPTKTARDTSPQLPSFVTR